MAETEPKPATEATIAAHTAATSKLEFLTNDPEEPRARRGLLRRPTSAQIPHGAGWNVWDLDDYAFLEGDTPSEVHPALWRQARLNTEAGLYEIAPGFWQVRGLDLANLTVVDGAEGRIVIDPLTSTQTAAAALALVNEELGERPVTAVIYTHSHVDHFGGVHGVVDADDVRTGRIPVIAPAGFLEAAVSENVVAGTAMTRRASYMYGALLPKGPHGHVDAGLGKGIPLLADQGLIAPTIDIADTGTELVVDGVRIVFQVTPDTEAPAEMNFWFPDHRVLCMAENCTCTLHNVYTPRGTPVRDALAWSRYIQEALDLWADDADVLFATHHWPCWGHDEIRRHLESQRDAYRFIHDQTLRLANHGHTSREIAEELCLPDALRAEPRLREFYGTVSHNAKAVYQRYLGWFDGNPANLNPHPPVEAAHRYLDYMGGADTVLDKARASFDAGDYRWVAEVVGHVVFADPDNRAARNLQADAFEQLGYQSESAPWRDFYLTGAQELRHGHPSSNPGRGPSAETIAAMTVQQLWDSLGVRIDGPAAADRSWLIDAIITGSERPRSADGDGPHPGPVGVVTDDDTVDGNVVSGDGRGDDGRGGEAGERWIVGVSNGALWTSRDPAAARHDDRIELRTDHTSLGALVFGARPLDELEADGSVVVDNGRDDLLELIDVLDRFSLMFPIVTPREH